MTKDSVLAMLREETGYLSGETISRALGVSRAAVNAAVKTLRSEGYEILSSTNRGYCLRGVPDCLTRSELSAYLPARRMETVECLDCVDSTNDRLRELALAGAPEGQIVVANEQRNGRGRRGRAFVSPRDRGIYLSMLLHPQRLPSSMLEITAWTAVAVNNALQTVCGFRAGIKWVNDLVLNRRKVCGILTEMSVESESGYVQYVIVGIGLNVNGGEQDFPEELRECAASLAMETGASYARARLAAEIIQELDRLRLAWPQDRQAYLSAYRRDDITVGHEISVVRGPESRRGVAAAIEENFSLRVCYPDGSEETLSGGEVSICGLYGAEERHNA